MFLAAPSASASDVNMSADDMASFCKPSLLFRLVRHELIFVSLQIPARPCFLRSSELKDKNLCSACSHDFAVLW